MFDRVQVWALAGPLRDIQRLVPKLLRRCLGCVLRVVVLLESEPSPQSEVLSALEQVFIKDLSVYTGCYITKCEGAKGSEYFPEALYIWGIQASQLCRFGCEETEPLDQLFWHCPYVACFWSQVQEWLFNAG
jgi:hypothetical protein